jgi:hypothetical protein
MTTKMILTSMSLSPSHCKPLLTASSAVSAFPVAHSAARAPEAAPAFPVPELYQPPKSGSSNVPSNPAAVLIKQVRPLPLPPMRPDGPPRPPAQIGQRPGAPGAKPGSMLFNEIAVTSMDTRLTMNIATTRHPSQLPSQMLPSWTATLVRSVSISIGPLSVLRCLVQ